MSREIALATLVFMAFLGFAPVSVAMATQEPEVPIVSGGAKGTVDYWAVLVGVADYLYMSDLSYTDDDAIDMRAQLQAYPNWPATHIKLLLDSDASKDDISDAVTSWLDLQEDADDVVLFFFSGHGTYYDDQPPDVEPDGYDEYIVPYDAQYIEDCIRDDELDVWLDVLEANRIVVILDTCSSGGFIKGAEMTAKTVPGAPHVDLKDGFGRDIAELGRVVLTACDDHEISWETSLLENGVFSYYLIEALEGGLGGPADFDLDNAISAEELYDYAESKTASYTGDTQHPQLYDGYVPGGILLVVPEAPLGPVTFATSALISYIMYALTRRFRLCRRELNAITAERISSPRP